jgi:prepilin-type N-terminal cleavage/methylation domain-containing protein
MHTMSANQPQPHQSPASKSQLGFSLIELLVSIALLSIMGSIGLTLYAIINNSYQSSNIMSKMQTQGSQAMEVLERSIRGASDARTIPTGVGCEAYAQCLVLGVPSSSLEYQINGGCSQTVYGWKEPTASTNGELWRYYLNNDNTECNGSQPIDLFDSHARNGISVEQQAGAIFATNAGGDGVDSVRVSFKLAQGVTISNRQVSVPLKTTVSLRDY